MSRYDGLASYVETLNALGDESRLRLCALLRGRELCVSDLVRVTGMAQSRVSTHLGRLREAGIVWDRRQGAQSFYGLAVEALPSTARAILDDALRSDDATLSEDRARLRDLEAERRSGLPEHAEADIERGYSPGRTWQSLALANAALLALGDVLDVGSGDGAAAAVVAPYCRSLTCVDLDPARVAAAERRFARVEHARARVADAHDLPLPAASFDAVLLFHTLSYAERPSRVLEECARVMRPGGRLVVQCLDRHEQHEFAARHGERHPGFSPRTLRGMISKAGLEVASAEVVCRETRKPHLPIVLAVAAKPAARAQPR